MTSVWFVSAAHQRYALTDLCLEQRARVCAELADQGIDAHQVVAADDDNLDIARSHGFHAVEQANQPLGRKINDAIEYACSQGADYVATIGTDDWCLPSCISIPDEPLTIRSGWRLAVVDPSGRRMLRVRTWSHIGYIPWVVPRGLLAASGYRPCDDEIRRGLDGSIRRGITKSLPAGATRPNARRARREGVHSTGVFRPQAVDDLQCVDFKSPDVQLTPYDHILNVRDADQDEHEDPFALLRTRYPADLCDRMAKLYER